ncbi:tRNA-dihydrouridine synthase family protein [Candidatus Woesearchaeota archaeon]|nr:tRNA-dihydrouridine synthase family protein [Candidatus Woesearchaeota archaeon]
MKLWLAPLEGVSDCAFRTLCYQYGADLTFTEMIRVDSLVKGNKSSLSLLDLKNNTPTGIQLLAVKPKIVEEFVKKFASYSIDPVCFNLNLGCPSPDVIVQGGGAALVKRTARVQELVKILQKLGYPVSVKIRLGLNEFEKEKRVYLSLLKEVDADAFIIHARHARQKSSEKADWSVFEACLDTGKHIIPNGDINTQEDLAFFKSLGVKEVMIGRAAIRNPSVFQFLKGGKLENIAQVQKKYLALAEKYPSRALYQENVLSFLGKEAHSKKWMM